MQCIVIFLFLWDPLLKCIAPLRTGIRGHPKLVLIPKPAQEGTRALHGRYKEHVLYTVVLDLHQRRIIPTVSGAADLCLPLLLQVSVRVAWKAGHSAKYCISTAASDSGIPEPMNVLGCSQCEP